MKRCHAAPGALSAAYVRARRSYMWHAQKLRFDGAGEYKWTAGARLRVPLRRAKWYADPSLTEIAADFAATAPFTFHETETNNRKFQQYRKRSHTHTTSPGSTIQLVDFSLSLLNTNIYVSPREAINVGAMLQLLSVLQCVWKGLERRLWFLQRCFMFVWMSPLCSSLPTSTLSKSLHYCMRNALEMKSLFTFWKKKKRSNQA